MRAVSPLTDRSALHMAHWKLFGMSYFFEFILFFQSRHAWSALKTMIFEVTFISSIKPHSNEALDLAMV